MKNIIYAVCLSGGKDSVFMLLELIQRGWPIDIVLFFDTGKEFKAVYMIIERIKTLLQEKGIPFQTLHPEHPFDYDFSERPVRKRNGTLQHGYSWCGGNCRWMTKHKLLAFERYYRENYKDCTIVEYVGIASDERDRVKVPADSGTIKMYPLILWGYTENDCFVGCYKKGYDWTEPVDGDTDQALYQNMDRVSCFCCTNKSIPELRYMHSKLPGYWKQIQDMQRETDRPFKRGKTVWELEERFLNERQALDPNEAP